MFSQFPDVSYFQIESVVINVLTCSCVFVLYVPKYCLLILS